MNKKRVAAVLDYIIFVAGGIMYAIAINVFLAPNHIAPGGAGGLATVFNYLTGFPIGTAIFIINTPLFVWGRKLLGKVFFIKTLVVTVFISIGVDFIKFIPKYTGDRLLASIFGGLIMGVCFGFIFSRGGTSGGSDLLARIIKVRLPYYSMGKLVLIIDIFVITISTIVYKNIESGFYAVITLYISSKVVDSILNGLDFAKLIYIISDKSEEIAHQISLEIGRGATMLHGTGQFTGEDRKVLLIALKKYQMYTVRSIVRELDPHAFMIFTDATEVLGQGFKQKEVI
ncbi:MAG: YitT family protein [Bacillota bacterium]|nr:YitT family protein [Bacillota bacterium]